MKRVKTTRTNFAFFHFLTNEIIVPFFGLSCEKREDEEAWTVNMEEFYTPDEALAADDVRGTRFL